MQNVKLGPCRRVYLNFDFQNIQMGELAIYKGGSNRNRCVSKGGAAQTREKLPVFTGNLIRQPVFTGNSIRRPTVIQFEFAKLKILILSVQ